LIVVFLYFFCSFASMKVQRVTRLWRRRRRPGFRVPGSKVMGSAVRSATNTMPPALGLSYFWSEPKSKAVESGYIKITNSLCRLKITLNAERYNKPLTI
jgi:hypothetical protein